MSFTESNPRPLNTEFSRAGMTQRQIKRAGFIAMFSCGAGFEVVKIKVAKPQKLPNGETAPWRETYPSDAEFGARGWYWPPEGRAEAEIKFASLVEAAKLNAK